MKLTTNPTGYPLQWFDLICHETLNPAKSRVQELTPKEADQLLNSFNHEFITLQNHIKAHLLALSSPKKIRTAVMQYHTAIMLLNRQASANYNLYPVKNDSLKKVGNTLLGITEELARFLEVRYSPFIPFNTIPSDTPAPASLPEKPPSFKVVCNLSVDQIGLILKAADDVKLLMAKSLSLVFKSIVPFLSTKKSSELSWDSMRSHTYHPEEADKEAVIRILEAMIKKIRAY